MRVRGLLARPQVSALQLELASMKAASATMKSALAKRDGEVGRLQMMLRERDAAGRP